MRSIASILILCFGTMSPLHADVQADAGQVDAGQVDALLRKDWSAHQLTASKPANDETFVRRVYLDVAGRIPTFRETEEFLASSDTDKRAALVDRLLASEGYVSHFYNYWSDILRNNSHSLGGLLSTSFTLFLKDSLRANKPYDQFVREMLSAQGKGWENGAVAYYLRDRGMPLDNMAITVRVFLGTRIECAQCHDHPFDTWTQMQFYQMAAFTHGVDTADYSGGPMTGVMKRIQTENAEMRQQVQRAKGKASAELLAEQAPKADRNRFTHSAVVTTWGGLYFTWSNYNDKPLRLPHDYKYANAKPRDEVRPATMMGKPVTLAPGSPPLVDFAQWMTSSENPRFTRVIANRLWKKVFGLGLIEPVDEIMEDTVAAKPELMTHLEHLMIRMNYDMRGFLRVLLNTRAYQSEVTREEITPGTAYHFTGPLLRSMSAEQMWDSLVTLIQPTPDLLNMEAQDNLKRRLLGASKLCDALEALPPEELEAWLVAAGTRNGKAANELAAIQRDIVQAREKGDKARADALIKQSEPLRRIAQQAVNDEVLIPALAKLNAKASGGATLTMPDKPFTDVITQIPIAGYELPRDNPARKQADTAARAVIADAARYFGIPETEKVYFPGLCLSAARNWPRAADMAASPAAPGHYLREFGQSDRESIDNSNTDASIPQALILMNSDLVPVILSEKSQLMLSIHKAAETGQQIDNAYLALLARKPTDSEKRLWSEAQTKGLSSIDDLIHALLNTRQFIFVQ